MNRMATFVRDTDEPSGTSMERPSHVYSAILDILLDDLLVAGTPGFVPSALGSPDAKGTRVVSW